MFKFTPMAAALTNAGMRTPAFVQRRIHMPVPIYAGCWRSWIDQYRARAHAELLSNMQMSNQPKVQLP